MIAGALVFVIVFVAVTLTTKNDTPAKRIKPMKLRIVKPRVRKDASTSVELPEDEHVEPFPDTMSANAHDNIFFPPLAAANAGDSAPVEPTFNLDNTPTDPEPTRPRTSMLTMFKDALNKIVQSFALRRSEPRLEEPDGLGYTSSEVDHDDEDRVPAPTLAESAHQAERPKPDHPFGTLPSFSAGDDVDLEPVARPKAPFETTPFSAEPMRTNGNGHHGTYATVLDYAAPPASVDHVTSLRNDVAIASATSLPKVGADQNEALDEDEITISYDDEPAWAMPTLASPLRSIDDGQSYVPPSFESSFEAATTHHETAPLAPEIESDDYPIVLEYEGVAVPAAAIEEHVQAHDSIEREDVARTIEACETQEQHVTIESDNLDAGAAELDVAALLAEVKADQATGYVDSERARQRAEEEAVAREAASTSLRASVLWPQEYLGAETAALDVHERIQFVRALAAMDDFDGAAKTLYRACSEEPEPDVLFEAYKSLTDSYNGEYLKAAHEVFLDNDDTRIREVAARGIKQLAEVPG
jgi:hypothetical protein